MGDVLRFRPNPVSDEEIARRDLIAKRMQLQEDWDRAVADGYVPTEAEAQAVCDAIQHADDMLTDADIRWGIGVRH